MFEMTMQKAAELGVGAARECLELQAIEEMTSKLIAAIATHNKRYPARPITDLYNGMIDGRDEIEAMIAETANEVGIEA